MFFLWCCNFNTPSIYSQLSQTFSVFSLHSSPSIFNTKINSNAHWSSAVFLLSIIRLLDHIFSWHLAHWFMNYFVTLSTELIVEWLEVMVLEIWMELSW